MLKTSRKITTGWSITNSLAKKSQQLLIYFKKRKKFSIVILIAFTIIGFFGYQKFKPKNPEDIYQLYTLTPGDLQQTVSASGTVKALVQVDLKFQTSGQLAWVGVKEGDQVEQWQALASLDQRALRKTLDKYLLTYAKERNDFEEDKQTTYKDQVLTDTVRRILQKNQWDLQKAVLDVELNDLTLKYATLITPIKGIVTHIDTPVAGVNITPATAVFTVADPKNLEFVARIDEVDVGPLKSGQLAEIILDSYPDQPIPATLSSIDFASSTDSSGSTVYLAHFNLLNSDLNQFRLGMNGEVIITTNQKENTLSIPYQALIESETGPQVQLFKEGQIITQKISTGLTGEEKIEVLSGLKPGDVIVVAKRKKD